jgi:hypothetical protein
MSAEPAEIGRMPLLHETGSHARLALEQGRDGSYLNVTSLS